MNQPHLLRSGATLLLLGLLFSACSPGGRPELDPSDLALLRLDYLESAARLPPLSITSIQIPNRQQLGSFSPVVWRVRSRELAGRELFRPLPQDDLDLLLLDTMLGVFEDFGFNVRGRPTADQFTLRVEVERLILTSDDQSGDHHGFRSCDLKLRFILEEFPTGLEIETFSGEGARSLIGSWVNVRGDSPSWIPRPGEVDPTVEAVERAAIDFLAEARGFWLDPDSWQQGLLELSRR